MYVKWVAYYYFLNKSLIEYRETQISSNFVELFNVNE